MTELSLGEIKRGDTFSLSATITDTATGDAVTGVAARMRCQMRYVADGPLIAELTVTESSTPGTYLFTAASTAEWCVGRTLKTDIEYTDTDGNIASSVTLTVKIVEDYTHGN